MVAEKKGVIRFYSLATQQAFLSLDCGHVPLVSADWCYANTVRVAAVAGTDWFIFDTSRSRYILHDHITTFSSLCEHCTFCICNNICSRQTCVSTFEKCDSRHFNLNGNALGYGCNSGWTFELDQPCSFKAVVIKQVWSDSFRYTDVRILPCLACLCSRLMSLPCV